MSWPLRETAEKSFSRPHLTHFHTHRGRPHFEAVAVTGPPVGQALGFVVGPSMVTTVDTLWLVRREVQG